MTANPKHGKKVSRVLMAIVFVLFVMALAYDTLHIRKWFLGQAIEDGFVAAYPTTKFYRDYIMRVLESEANAHTQHFYPLHERDADERIVSVNSVGWIDLRQGPVTVTFPDLPVFRRATVTFVEWDGLAIGGESAYRKSYTLSPPTSHEPGTPDTLATRGGTILAFVRIPTADSPAHKSLAKVLGKIRFSNSRQELLQGQPIVAEDACKGFDLGRVFVRCMEALIPMTELPTEQVNAYLAAREKIGDINNIPMAEWTQSIDDARQMIDQTVTNGITLVTNHMWIAYQHMFTLQPAMVQLRLNRAAYVRSDLVAVPSNKMKYAIKRYNARGEAVHGLDNDYLLNFDPRLLPKDVTEWHFIVRDHRKRLHKHGQHYTVNYDDALKREADGTINIYFANKKPGNIPLSNWLHTPDTFFEIVFMGRGTKAGTDFDYFEYLGELELIKR